MSLKAFANFLKSSLKADPAAVDTFVAETELAEGLAKAAEQLRPGEFVGDHWNAGKTNASATKEQINVGEPQKASGGGAERMISTYAHPATQMHGVAVTPEKIADMLGSLAAMGKSHGDALNTMVSVMSTGFATLNETLKGKPPAAASDGAVIKADDEDSEVAEVNEEKCKSRILSAKAVIRKLRAEKAKLEDADDDAAIKASNKIIKSLKQEAGILLGKARTHAYAAGSATLKAEIKALAAKSDVGVVQEEDDDDEGKGKSEIAATVATPAAPAAAAAPVVELPKANGDDKGNQADRMDRSNGNQAAAAKAIEDRIDAALKGISTLRTDVKGMFDVLTNKTTAADLVPSMVKAKPEQRGTILDLIAAQEDGGNFTEQDAAIARRIVSMSGAVAKGTFDEATLRDNLSKAPVGVQAFFNTQAQAA